MGAYFIGAASSAAVLTYLSRTAAVAIPLILILIVVAIGTKQGKKRALDS